MIDGLVSGKLHIAPVLRQTKANHDYVTVTVRVPLSAENESVFAHVVAFSESACQALRALDVGDAVSVAGKLTPGAWLDKEGNARPSVDVVADQVLSVYSIRKKRDAAQGRGGGGQREDRPDTAPVGGDIEDDDVPF
ncbi:single-stranded DNA-binding protein [Ralstonia chuxiongensis]|uniref:single-stranded DNA-binding protein n=1 Tax=Ralstonia chuxiongensis TaxID=2957504 RepID=UPI0028F65E1A|nr:single-stranded DNA-binding protein [Ralstonia chuxiongensis]CAJ0777677.1 Single-stranded DNA-binding protein [Ralstonia chuxiongensis]